MVKSFGLEDHEVELIAKNTTIKFFPKGTVLLEPGQVAKHCYMVLHGAVRAYYLKDGEEHSTAFYLEMEPVNSFTSFTPINTKPPLFSVRRRCLAYGGR